MKDKLNIVIVGGGSTWCPGILKAHGHSAAEPRDAL